MFAIMNEGVIGNAVLKRAGSWLACVALVSAAGCSVGPDYKAPKSEAPAAFGNGAGLQTNNPAVRWWNGFKDAKLEQLVERAVTNNHDLRIAAASLREARALRRSAQFDFGPTVSTRAGYTKTQNSSASVFGIPQRQLDLYEAGFDATWELDIFGGVRRGLEAAGAEVQAAEANRQDVLVSLMSEVARNYLELRGLQNELSVAKRNAENQQETLKITQARLDAGRGTELDVARAQAQLSRTLATIPPLEVSISNALHRLGVLLGAQPTALRADLEKPEPLPALPQLVSIGTPEELLRRRADVRLAERRLAAATARIGVETADLFPRVFFNGNVRLEATSFTGLGQSGSDAWAFGPRITWAALDYGHVRARIQAAGARAEGLLAEYERTVLTTLEETENALVEFSKQQVRRDNLRDAVEASRKAVTLARQRFENGVTDFLVVLDAERVLLEAEDQLAQSQTRTATALVAVYKALGGGWEIEQQRAAAK